MTKPKEKRQPAGQVKKYDITTQRLLTLVGLGLGQLHMFLSAMNYVTFIRDAHDELSNAIRRSYLAFVIIGSFAFFALSSIFYMWSLRYYKPESLSQKKRSYGLAINLFFSDIPLFFIEVQIAWRVNFLEVIQALSFIVTCMSFAYSLLTLWLFVTSRVALKQDTKGQKKKQVRRLLTQPAPTGRPTGAPGSFAGAQFGGGDDLLFSPITSQPLGGSGDPASYTLGAPSYPMGPTGFGLAGNTAMHHPGQSTFVNPASTLHTDMKDPFGPPTGSLGVARANEQWG